MKEEDIKISQKFVGSDASTTSYSQSPSSSLSNHSNSLQQPSSKKRTRKPTFYSYLISRGEEHAEALKAYTKWKKALPKECMGTSRPLLPQETAYFDFAQKYYQCDTLRPKKHRFISPPRCWQDRVDSLSKPTNYQQLINSPATSLGPSVRSVNATTAIKSSAPSKKVAYSVCYGPLPFSKAPTV